VVTDFDTAISILENGTRREILKHLVREAHYPLQLAELLDVSQQAIMKHLKVLEESGFVTSEKVPSEKGGPPKRIYAITQSFSLRLDLGPDLFRAEHRQLPSGGPARLSNQLPEDVLNVAERVRSAATSRFRSTETESGVPRSHPRRAGAAVGRRLRPSDRTHEFIAVGMLPATLRKHLP